MMKLGMYSFLAICLLGQLGHAEGVKGIDNLLQSKGAPKKGLKKPVVELVDKKTGVVKVYEVDAIDARIKDASFDKLEKSEQEKIIDEFNLKVEKEGTLVKQYEVSKKQIDKKSSTATCCFSRCGFGGCGFYQPYWGGFGCGCIPYVPCVPPVVSVTTTYVPMVTTCCSQAYFYSGGFSNVYSDVGYYW